jgi:hypothetical protein
MPLPAFSSLPRRNQLAIVYGVPAGIAALLLFWAWKDLGRLGRIDPDITDTDGQPIPNRLPAFVQRSTPNGIWSDPESGITAIQGHIGEKDAIIKRGAEVDKKLASLQGQIKAAEERLPQESEKAEMRDMIERLAREIPKDIGTVELKSVSILDSGDKGDTRTITFQTDLSGDQDGIIKYIDSIEKNTRFMAVNNLSIRSGAVTYDAGAKKLVYALHGVHMDIVTYVYNPARKAPPAAQ